MRNMRDEKEEELRVSPKAVELFFSHVDTTSIEELER